jgi:DNA-binding MarR family transcriptional regulator
MKLIEKQQQEGLRRNEEKWTRPLMEAGWTAVPSVILERQQALGLDPLDVNILLQLARYWWYPENLPHPSKKAIAECMGVDVSTVRKRIAALEEVGLIQRTARWGKHGRQETNFYDFSGLIAAATPYAKEAIQEREQRKTEDAARRRRRGRKLELVHGQSSGGQS